MQPLTPTQLKCLAAIQDFWKRHGKAPSVAGIAIKLGVNRASAHRLMSECRDRGAAYGPVTTGDWRVTLDGAALLAEAPPKKRRRPA
jgi:DNA-binding IclR family transcriptional regulator